MVTCCAGELVTISAQSLEGIATLRKDRYKDLMISAKSLLQLKNVGDCLRLKACLTRTTWVATVSSSNGPSKIFSKTFVRVLDRSPGLMSVRA
jgi:hypothetical protein